MQVILLENVSNLGVAGDTVNVKNGYARNYLIPRNKCLRATKDNIAYFEQKKSEINAKNQEKKQAAEKDAAAIEGTQVILIRQAADDGRLYGSVTGRDVHAAVSKKTGKEIYKNGVKNDDNIKYIGVYGASLELYSGVFARCVVIVAPSEDEAVSLLAAHEAEKKAEKESEEAAIADEAGETTETETSEPSSDEESDS